jgi:hypothetical protein
MVLDYGAFHKAKSLRIPENIYLLFLTPYSPELNPAEKIWAILKGTSPTNSLNPWSKLECLLKIASRLFILNKLLNHVTMNMSFHLKFVLFNILNSNSALDNSNAELTKKLQLM